MYMRTRPGMRCPSIWAFFNVTTVRCFPVCASGTPDTVALRGYFPSAGSGGTRSFTAYQQVNRLSAIRPGSSVLRRRRSFIAARAQKRAKSSAAAEASLPALAHAQPSSAKSDSVTLLRRSAKRLSASNKDAAARLGQVSRGENRPRFIKQCLGIV